MSGELSELNSVEIVGGESGSPKLFIKILAAFYPEGVDIPDAEALGLNQDQLNDMYPPEERPAYVCIPHIVSMYYNNKGGLNITTVEGDRWSTSEGAGKKIIPFFEALSVDLT